jgi:hypothetical protein
MRLGVPEEQEEAATAVRLLSVGVMGLASNLEEGAVVEATRTKLAAMEASARSSFHGVITSRSRCSLIRAQEMTLLPGVREWPSLT